VSEEKFSKCGEGKKSKCRISGVRKKEIERKVREKESKCFGGRKGDFSKFVLTSWALYCKTWLKFGRLICDC
jgi:hypothetical protein